MCVCVFCGVVVDRGRYLWSDHGAVNPDLLAAGPSPVCAAECTWSKWRTWPQSEAYGEAGVHLRGRGCRV